MACSPSRPLWSQACPSLRPGHEQDTVLYLFFSENQVDAKGKQHKKYTYENMMMPHDKLRSLTHAEGYLKSGMNFENFIALCTRSMITR